MSENAPPQESSGRTLTRRDVIELLAQNYDRLPDLDQKMFHYGPMYLAGNSSLAGLISNSLYRRVLNVTQGHISSSLPMAVLPFLTTVALYNVAVSKPLLSGELNCPTCAWIRGALIGVVGGGVYPILLALPVNAGLASRYNTAPLPEKGNVLRFWAEVSRPILRKMGPVLLLQALFGAFLGNRHFESYMKLNQLTFGRNIGEELGE